MKVGRFFLEHVLPFAVSSTILLGACAAEGSRSGDIESTTAPILSANEFSNFRYLVVDNLPQYYKNQLFDVTSLNHVLSGTYLNDLKKLELKINANDDLSWLRECQSLTFLSVCFDDYVNASRLSVIGELKNLRQLNIAGSKYQNFDNSQDRDDYVKKVGTNKVFMVSDFDNSLTLQHELLDDKDAFSFIQFLPNLEFVSLSYFADLDNLSFLELNKNIKTIQIKDSKFPISDVEKEMPFLNNLPRLHNLYLEVDGLSFTPKNIKYLGDKFDVIIRTPNGSYKLDYEIRDSENYLTFSGASQFYGVDISFFKSLVGVVDKIYFENIGPYDLAISLSSQDINYLSEHYEVVFDSNDMRDQVAKIDRELNAILSLLDIKPWDSEKARLDKILLYVKNNYNYDFQFTALSPLEKDFDLYYQGGYLKGALTRREIICGNYAGLVSALLKRVNMESYVITGNSLVMGDKISVIRHAWNIVKVDGAYYYLDATGIEIDQENLAWYNQVLEFFGIKDNHGYLKDPKAPLSVILNPDYIPQDLEFRGVNDDGMIFNTAFWVSSFLAGLFFYKALENDKMIRTLKPRNKKE